MISNGKKYNWVNEKIVNGKTYTCWRADADPRDTIIVRDKVHVKKTKKKLKEEWLNPEGLWLL